MTLDRESNHHVYPDSWTEEERTYARNLWAWDWGVSQTGYVLHHARQITFDGVYGETAGQVVTSCGRNIWLTIPGIATRMGAPRCVHCCKAVGYPTGNGSPKNDDRIEVAV